MLDTTRIRRALHRYETLRACSPRAEDAHQVHVRIEDYGDVVLSETTRRMICEEVAASSATSIADAQQEIIEACKELSNVN